MYNLLEKLKTWLSQATNEATGVRQKETKLWQRPGHCGQNNMRFLETTLSIILLLFFKSYSYFRSSMEVEVVVDHGAVNCNQIKGPQRLSLWQLSWTSFPPALPWNRQHAKPDTTTYILARVHLRLLPQKKTTIYLYAQHLTHL